AFYGQTFASFENSFHHSLPMGCHLPNKPPCFCPAFQGGAKILEKGDEKTHSGRHEAIYGRKTKAYHHDKNIRQREQPAEIPNIRTRSTNSLSRITTTGVP